MEKKLTGLFSYQRIEQEPHLQELIRETEERWGTSQAQELTDEALEQVAAAGEPQGMGLKRRPFKESDLR